MDIVGFCTIRPNATTCKGAERPEEFMGKDCPVMEFDQWGGVLCLNPQGTAMAMFDKDDIKRQFKCKMRGEFIYPPDLDEIGQMAYMSKVISRKGGYNALLRNMVIQASLMKGEFNDNFLFAKEREENARKEREGTANVEVTIGEVADFVMETISKVGMKAAEHRAKIKQYRDEKNKMAMLEDELRKYNERSSYWSRRMKPRKLRRQLRRLKNKIGI